MTWSVLEVSFIVYVLGHSINLNKFDMYVPRESSDMTLTNFSKGAVDGVM